MIPRHQSSASARGPRHSRRRSSNRVWRGVTIATVTVLVFGVSSAAAVVSRLNNVHRVDIAGLVPTIASSAKANSPSDASAGKPVNILLIGSDARNGENAAIGGEAGGERSDTAIVMHISADRSRVELVSIPRDSLVTIPSCTMTNGRTTRAQKNAMFNNAFATGWDTGGDIASAATCSMNTVQVNTGVPLDHFVVVDFAGFQKMVDAVGGVQLCIAQSMQDSMTGLNLAAGLQQLNGTQALQFARARHVSGTDGSDITRIKHQQQLLGALAHEVLSKNVLTNAPQLLTFVSAVTSSLTMDSGLDLQTITGLAYGLRHVSGASIVFMTIPWGPAPTDPNRVVWTSAAKKIWADLASDTPLVPRTSAGPSGSASAAATPNGSASSAPSSTASAGPTATAPSGVTSVQDVQNQSAACAA